VSSPARSVIELRRLETPGASKSRTKNPARGVVTLDRKYARSWSGRDAGHGTAQLCPLGLRGRKSSRPENGERGDTLLRGSGTVVRLDVLLAPKDVAALAVLRPTTRRRACTPSTASRSPSRQQVLRRPSRARRTSRRTTVPEPLKMCPSLSIFGRDDFRPGAPEGAQLRCPCPASRDQLRAYFRSR